MNVKLVANVVEGDFYGLAGVEYDFPEDYAKRLIADKSAIDPAAPPPKQETEDEGYDGSAWEGLRSVPREGSADENADEGDLACPHGCRDGKPFATAAARNAHITKFHAGE